MSAKKPGAPRAAANAVSPTLGRPRSMKRQRLRSDVKAFHGQSQRPSAASARQSVLAQW